MADGHSPAPQGHNGPPADAAPNPFDAIRIHMDDLLIEARNWADGQKVESDEQAATVDRLIGDLREAASTADDTRKEEVAPLDKQRDAIQDRYNEYIAPLRNKKPGSVTRAISALLATVDPWRQKKADEAAAAADAARAAAQKIADEAAAAIRNTDAADLEGREAAEALVQQASNAQRDANRAEKAATTGTGLRTEWVATLKPEPGSFKLALIHYMNEQPAEFMGLVQHMAATDARNGKRQIPGYDVTPEKRAV